MFGFVCVCVTTRNMPTMNSINYLSSNVAQSAEARFITNTKNKAAQTTVSSLEGEPLAG